MIALVSPVSAECNLLLGSLSLDETVDTGSRTVYRGMISGVDVALCIAGMGKVNAAHAATLLITGFNPDAIILFGIGGAYPSGGAQIGEIVLASEEIYGDEGVLLKDGFRTTDFIGIPLAKTAEGIFYNRFPADAELLRRAQGSLASAQSARHTVPRTGRFVTLSTSTGTRRRALEIEALYQPLCENMEGAAVAHVATLHNVPWLEVRAISNMVEDRDISKWDIRGAAEAVQNAVLRILEDL